MTDRGRRNLIIWMVILSIPLAIITAIIFAAVTAWKTITAPFDIFKPTQSDSYQQPRNSGRQQTRTTTRTQGNLFVELNKTPESLDSVVFKDGDAGWFALTDPIEARDVKVRFVRRRFVDAFSNTLDEATNCPASGTIVLGLQNDATVGSLKYCGSTRLDLSELRPFASPVQITHAQLNRTDVLRLRDQIAAEPDMIGVSIDEPSHPFAAYFEIEGPHIWSAVKTSFEMKTDIENKLTTLLNKELATFAGSYAVEFEYISSPSNTLYVKESEDSGYLPGPTGYSYHLDGQKFIMPDLATLVRLGITIDCDKPACSAIHALDLKPLFAPDRDLMVLEQAMSTALLLPTPPGSNNAPSFAEIVADDLMKGDLIEWKYAVTYVTSDH